MSTPPITTNHLLQSFQLEHLPPQHLLHVALYHNVKNASFLHQQLLAGNTDFEYALVEASIILSKIHVLSAAFRAVNDMLAGRLRSRNVHSEMVFSLGPSNNIAESFRRFGISPTTSSLLVLKLSTPSQPFTAEEVQRHLGASVEGGQVPFEDEVLQTTTDVTRVKKIYKLNSVSSGKKVNGAVNGDGDSGGGGGGGGGGGLIGDEWRELEIMVLGAMALRGSTN